jgi:hypothetical protein
LEIEYRQSFLKDLKNLRGTEVAELVAHPPSLIPKRNLKGLWADHNIDLDEQDLRELRQEICPRV